MPGEELVGALKSESWRSRFRCRSDIAFPELVPAEISVSARAGSPGYSNLST